MKRITLLDSIVRTTSQRPGGFKVESYSLTGEPHAAALLAAVEETYPRPDIDWPLWSDDPGRPAVTLLIAGGNMLGARSLDVYSGRVFPARSGGYAFLPKGARNKGIKLRTADVLDIVAGFDRVDTLRERVGASVASLPTLEPLTVEALRSLPERAPEDGPVCTLAVFGRWALPDAETATALWLLHSYIAEDDIAEGVLLLPPEVGTSEHGSVYGRELLGARVGKVAGFAPVTLRDAVAFTDRPLSEALAYVCAS